MQLEKPPLVHWQCPNCKRPLKMRSTSFPFVCPCGCTTEQLDEIEARQRETRDPITNPCIFQGEEVNEVLCDSCRGKVLLKVFACPHKGRAMTARKNPPAEVTSCHICPAYRYTRTVGPAVDGRSTWLTLADLAKDTLAMAGLLPANVAGIVGVPRSGLLPASILATHLHLPLFTLQHDIKNVGCGWRLSDKGSEPLGDGPLVVADDTSMSGHTSKAVRDNWSQIAKGRELIFAVSYSAPRADHTAGLMPDLAGRIIKPPHLLEWNFFNSWYVTKSVFDFDGIFTKDGTVEPLYLPRKWRVPLIVTGRLERDRAGSEAWLREHGIQFDRMVMWQGTEAERDKDARKACVEYKAKHYIESKLDWFVESEPEQARAIAAIAHKPVICPAAGLVFKE